MKRLGSLFERLGGDIEQRANWTEEACTTASVASHLAKMLSTRAGSVQTLPDYGLPDLNDMRLSLHDALTQAQMAIEHFIDTYEPRLSHVKVISLPRAHNHLSLLFRIEGLLEVAGDKRPIHFTASLDASGKVTLS